MVVSSQDIVRECSAALEILSEGSSVVDMRAHVIALLALSKAHLLPPPQQSLSVFGANLNTAIHSLERVDVMLKDVSTLLSFENLPDGRVIEPTLLKAALSAVASVRTDDALVIARAAESFCMLHATADESSFLNPLLMRIIPFFPGTSLLDMQCGSGLRVIQAQRRIYESGAALLSTRLLQAHLEEDDRDAECRARLMLYLSGITATLSPVGTALMPGTSAKREYDRMFVQTIDRVPDIPGVLRRMGDHTTCVLILSDIAAGCMTKKDMALLLDRDVLDSVITLRSSARAPWHLMILRGRKPVDRRHRVLFYDHVDPFDGPGIDALSAETIAEAMERFSSTGQHCRVLHRNDIVSIHEPQTINNGIATSEFEPLQGLSSADFAALDARCIERGFDIHSLFSFNSRACRYEPSLADKHLLRIAVASSPALKNAEVRTHYAFAMWWTSIAPLLGVVDAPITQLQDSFESTLSADNIILPRQARAVFREWWWDIDDDRSMLARYGATALMRSRIDSLIADAQLKAKDFWFEADASHRSLLEFLCPELVNKLITHGEHVASLNQSLHEAAHQAPKNLADLMVQRREELLMQKIPHSDLFEIVARERMLELRHRIDEMKIHMAALHTRAKEHRADDRRTQQFDDTVSLQDSVAALLKQIVPAQSELKLLEKSIAPIEDLKRERELGMELMEEFVREITPALVAIRGSMSPLHAEALAILHFRDKLSRRIESTISANRDVLICELESLWNRFEEGILITSKLEL